MECCIPVLVVAVVIGLSALLRGDPIPELITVLLKEFVDSISDKAAFSFGCLAGSLSAILLIYLDEQYFISAQCIFLAIVFIAGATSGAITGALWAILKHRHPQKGAKNGAVGGAITAILTIPIVILLAMVGFAM